MKSILEEAIKVTQNRQVAYDKPEDNFKRIADFWETHRLNKTHEEITPADVAQMMILMKIAREMWSHKIDNPIDIAGYAHCLARVEGDYNEEI